jgi:hypothetical protein
MNTSHALIPWLPLFGPIVAAVVAVLGWFAAHRLGVRKDMATRRRELRVEYLIEAYRRLEGAAQRSDVERRKDFESAVADIQLFGSGRQISLVHELVQAIAKDGYATFNPLLELLRSELRHELGMRPDGTHIQIFRFSANETEKRTPENAI